MKQLFAFFTLLLIASAAFSQDARVPRKVEWKVIVTDSIKRIRYGYLAGMADSGIIMVKNPIVFDHSLVGPTANTMTYQNISEIKIQRKGSVGRGILIGGLSGMVMGGIVGLITYKKPTCADNPFCVAWDFGPGYDALAGASVGTITGVIVGGILGAVAKKRFTIGGNRNKFAHMKANVLDMTYIK